MISGEFSGWNLGLAAGGFVGLAIATVVITMMYVLLCLSLAEMAAALPHTGGAYSFARTSMGPWGGFVTGMAENMEYIVTPAVIAYFAGSYLRVRVRRRAVARRTSGLAWWIVLYVAFVGLNVLGAQISFRFSVLITAAALLILVVFFVAAVPHVDVARHAMTSRQRRGTAPPPFGSPGILFAMPFAVWFYLGIEELPLAAEETHDPARDLPRGILWGHGDAGRVRAAHARSSTARSRREPPGSARRASPCSTAFARSSATPAAARSGSSRPPA